jgi:hypothetical protein
VDYLIRPDDGHSYLGVATSDQKSVLTPQGWDCEPIAGWGDFRLRVSDAEVSFSLEEPGWQVTIEGPMNEMAADGLVAVIAQQIADATGIPTYWLALG